MLCYSHTCQPSRKLTSHLAVPETFKIIPEIYSRGKCIILYITIKYKSDHDRMLVGSGSVPTRGWMPVGEKLRTIAQGVSEQVAAMVERESLQYLIFFFFKIFDSEFTSECLNSPLGALSCSVVLQKQAKSCKMSGIVLHIQIPGLASMRWTCKQFHEHDRRKLVSYTVWGGWFRVGMMNGKLI